MIEDPVLIPFQRDPELEVDCVTELRYLQHVPQTGGDLHLDGDDGVVRGVDVEGRHLVVVALPEHQQGAVILVRLVPAVHDLVAPLVHAGRADHVSARENKMLKGLYHDKVHLASQLSDI